MPVCLLGLGSNQGDRRAALDAAVAELARSPQIKILAHSAWRETAPVGGPPGQAPFLNGALSVETSLGPHELLAVLRQIENRLGREPAERWAARTIDLDLLLYDELVLDAPTLVLPHPRMAWRRFVLEPAAEVAGAMLHPVIRWTVARLLEHLNSAPPYVAITGPIAAGKTQLAERLAAAISARPIAEQLDWDRLDAFYANPTATAWQMELEFLRQRARLLSSFCCGKPRRVGTAHHSIVIWREKWWAVPTLQYPNTFPQQKLSSRHTPCADTRSAHRVCRLRWTVSDFWFDQSAAFARAWLPAEQLPAYLELYEQLRSEVVQPKLIVLLDAPAEELRARVRRRGRQCEQRLTEGQLDRIRQALREQAGRPELGPVLHVAAADPDSVFAEVLAAVRGME